MREIFASGGPVQASAVVEDGNLVEFFEDECDALADTVILGKVSRVVPGLQAAFVDIGEEKNGFLPLAEKKLTDGARYTGLEEKLQAGDRVLVQVRREAMGSKGAFLSRDLSLAGSFSILMPWLPSMYTPGSSDTIIPGTRGASFCPGVKRHLMF